MENETSRVLTAQDVSGFLCHLREEERSAATLEKYTRDLNAFLCWLGGSKVDKCAVVAYKKDLVDRYQPASVNAKLAAVNGLLAFLGWNDCRVRALKVQRSAFCSKEKELSKAEYRRLLDAAQRRGNRRLYLLIETLCATGIRVSEHKFITVEAARTGRATVTCKGKTRAVFLPPKLCKLLLGWCRSRGIAAGSVFVSRNGKPLDRCNIWHDMKALCESAGVAPGKVFPHNLRHLFARSFYAVEKDLSRLADLLGHSSVNTTRIYTVESGEQHERKVAAMGLVV